MFPFLFFFPKRVRIGALVAVVTLQLIMPRLHWSTSGWAYFRTDAIALGVLVAMFSDHYAHRRVFDWVQARRGAIALGAIFLLPLLALSTASQFHPSNEWAPYSIGLVALVSTALVLITSLNLNLIVPDGIARNLLVWVGGRSFALPGTPVSCFYLDGDGLPLILDWK